MVGFKDTVCYVETGYKKRLFYVKEIHGEKGSLSISAFPNRDIKIYLKEKNVGKPVPVKDDKYGGHYATLLFLEALAKNKPMPVSGEDGQKSTNIVLAAYLAAKEKRVVRLPLKEKVCLPL